MPPKKSSSFSTQTISPSKRDSKKKAKESSSSSPVVITHIKKVKSSKVSKKKIKESSSSKESKKETKESSSPKVSKKKATKKKAKSSSPKISKKKTKESSSPKVSKKKTKESSSPKVSKKKTKESSSPKVSKKKTKESSSPKVSKKKVSGKEEDKLKLVLDIEEDLKETTITKIIDMKDCIANFPNVKQYISRTNPSQSKLFKFKLFDLNSYILYLKNKEYNYIYWVIDDVSFNPSEDEDNPTEETLKIVWSKRHCEIAEISTQKAIIPQLKIRSNTYTGYSVCMILGLAFISKLGIHKVNILDASYVMSKCDWDKDKIRTQLKQSRVLTCKNSIYTKFGFHTQDTPSKQVCKITVGEILDEYKERITIIEKDIENTNIPKGLYNTSNWKTKIFNVVLIIKTLLKLSKDMTIEEWLKQIEVGDRRNYRAFLIGQLYTYPFSIDFVYKGKYFPSTTFATIYRENTNNDMINEDITETYQTILSKQMHKFLLLL